MENQILEITKAAGHVKTGYTTLFLISGLAYIVAWVLFNLIAPKMKKVDL